MKKLIFLFLTLSSLIFAMILPPDPCKYLQAIAAVILFLLAIGVIVLSLFWYFNRKKEMKKVKFALALLVICFVLTLVAYAYPKIVLMIISPENASEFYCRGY